MAKKKTVKKKAAKKQAATVTATAAANSVETAPVEKVGPVFEIAAADPYVDGTVRTFANLKNVDPLSLASRPFVLDLADECAKATLENYISRASTAGDTARINAAKEVLKKL